MTLKAFAILVALMAATQPPLPDPHNGQDIRQFFIDMANCIPEGVKKLTPEQEKQVSECMDRHWRIEYGDK